MNLYQQHCDREIEISSQHQIIHRLTSWCQGPNIQRKVKIYCFMLLWVYKNYPWLLFSPEIPRNTMLCVWEWHVYLYCRAGHRSHNLPTDNVPRLYRVICSGNLTDWLTRGLLMSLAPCHASYWQLWRPLIGWHQFVRLLSGIMHDCQHWSGIIMHAKCRAQLWQ